MNSHTYVSHPDRETRIRSATTAILAILALDLYPAHKRELLSVCIWKLTEADGKWNVRYWSEQALHAAKSELRHEHVYERRDLIERLLAGGRIEDVVALAVPCLVTVNEHKTLTRDGADEVGWDRYRKASIRVYDLEQNSWRA